MKNALGKHWIIEFYDCPAGPLSAPKVMEKALNSAALAMRATIVQSNFHHFTPLGVSGVVIIQESHLTIHTWPEHGYAAVDIFTCGDMDTERGVAFLEEALGAKTKEVKLMERGFVLSEKQRQGQAKK